MARRPGMPIKPFPTMKPSAEGARKSKYVVKLTDIWLESGRVAEGSVVELTANEARYFSDQGYLAPYIPDEEDEDLGVNSPETDPSDE